METMRREIVTVETEIQTSVKKVWAILTNPEHIVMWNQASDDWHTTKADNDLVVGGTFNYRMEAKDGSSGFDFKGKYTGINPYKELEFVLDDGRKVMINLQEVDTNKTRLTESFEAEDTFPVEQQKFGWQAILNNLKKYTEQKTMTERLRFETEIKANVEKVYTTMIDEVGYREWTSVFNPHSRFEGSWEKGADIKFIGMDEDGKEAGMFSRIKDNIRNEFISIQHLGILEQGDTELTSKENVLWEDGLENYTFIANGDSTILIVDLDSPTEYKEYFENTWPLALNKLKEICEQGV